VTNTPKIEDTEQDTTIGKLRALRYPFPAALVGKLPASKGRPELDFVGHGAVTDRLLEVDPFWTWEPFAITEEGLPRIVWLDDDSGVLWIKLTVAGVTRPGVGTASGGDVEKELIGDAIRNAAMRFGVALDLWIRGDPAETKTHAPSGSRRPKPTPAPATLSDWTIAAKLDLLNTVNKSKELARDLWQSAATNYGYGVDDDVADEATAQDILAEAKRLLLESGKVRREVYPPSPFDGSTEPFDMPEDEGVKP
jgi:hypothetical protein